MTDEAAIEAGVIKAPPGEDNSKDSISEVVANKPSSEQNNKTLEFNDELELKQNIGRFLDVMFASSDQAILNDETRYFVSKETSLSPEDHLRFVYMYKLVRVMDWMGNANTKSRMAKVVEYLNDAIRNRNLENIKSEKVDAVIKVLANLQTLVSTNPQLQNNNNIDHYYFASIKDKAVKANPSLVSFGRKMDALISRLPGTGWTKDRNEIGAMERGYKTLLLTGSFNQPSLYEMVDDNSRIGAAPEDFIVTALFAQELYRVMVIGGAANEPHNISFNPREPSSIDTIKPAFSKSGKLDDVSEKAVQLRADLMGLAGIKSWSLN